MEYKILYFLKILFLSVSEGPEKPLCKASHTGIYICPHTHTHIYVQLEENVPNGRINHPWHLTESGVFALLMALSQSILAKVP